MMMVKPFLIGQKNNIPDDSSHMFFCFILMAFGSITFQFPQAPIYRLTDERSVTRIKLHILNKMYLIGSVLFLVL